MGCCRSCFQTAVEETRPLLDDPFPRRFENVQDIEGAPVDRSWYHGKITNDEADYRIKAGARGHNGSYLVYDNPRKRGEYILIVYYKRKNHRWEISRRKSDGKYILGRDGPGVIGHDSVRDLIHNHRGLTGKPIKLEGGGVMTLSKEYVYVAS